MLFATSDDNGFENYMDELIKSNSICKPSNNVVAREIEGELIVVPLTAGMGDLEDELFTLNQTGRAIWGMLDGQRTVNDVVHELSNTYSASEGEIEKDVLGLVEELAKRKMIDVVERA